MRVLLIIAFSFLYAFVNAQKAPTLIQSFNLIGNQIETDNTGLMYLLKNEEIIQFNEEGKVLNRFSKKVAGNIYFMDFFNSLKPLVFYKNSSQFVLLDNRLAPRMELIDLSQLGFAQAGLVCASNMNYIWVYDNAALGLVRLNAAFENTIETGNLNQILGKELNPNYMFEKFNKLYLNDPALGILVFDIYGNYSNTIPVKGLKKFKVDSNLLYFADNSTLSIFDLIGKDFNQISLPVKAIVDVLISDNDIWIATANMLYHYKFE